MATELNQNELEKVVGGNDPTATAPMEDVYLRAKQELGKDYKWGGAGPEAYDAAGLVS